MIKNNVKKVVASLLVIMIVLTSVPVVNLADAAGVYIDIAIIGSSTVTEGGTISFRVGYTGEVALIKLTSGKLKLNGFTADSIEIIDIGSNARQINLKGVRGTGSGKTLQVSGSSAINSTGDLAPSITSAPFTINAAVAPDTQAPVLNITPKSNTVNVGGNVSVTANYTDDKGIASIMLGTGKVLLPSGFNANVSVTGSGLAQRTITLTNVQAAAGTYTIKVSGSSAMDAAGNLANADSFTVTVNVPTPKDTVAPVLAISPKTNTVNVGGNVSVTANYSDNVGIASIVLGTGKILLPSGFSANVSVTGSGLAQRTITLTNVQAAAGTYTIKVSGSSAIDAAGNLANADSFTVTVKSNPTPTATIKPTVTPTVKPTVTPTVKPTVKPTQKPSDWVANPNTGIE